MPQRSLVRRAALRLFLGGSVLALAACGRKGSPLPPLDVDPCYPRHYPMDESAKALCDQRERYAREHPPQPQEPRGRRQRQTTPAPTTQPPAAQPPAEQPPAGEQPPLAPLPGVPPFPGAPPVSPPPPGTQ